MMSLIAAVLIAAPPTTAVDLALGCVCVSRPDNNACKDERREDVTQTVTELLQVTAEKKDKIPESMRLILLAVACGESGMRNRPTCGGNPRCNDSETSGGMFQIKVSRKKPSLRWIHEKDNDGAVLDVWDHKKAGAFYLDRLVWGVNNPVRRTCGWRGKTVEQIWSIAAIRLGRGPFYREGGYRIQRCTPTSRYAALALRWYRRCPACWRLP